MKIARALLHGLALVGRVGRDILFGLAVSAILAGVGIFLYQLYAMLRYGTWPVLPFAGLLEWLTPLDSWLQHPQSWLGLHTILTDNLALAPLGLCLVVAGLVLSLLIEMCEASSHDYRSIWSFLNMPFVLFVLTLITAVTLLYTWETRQASHTLQQEGHRYALETLYRIDTVLEQLPTASTLSAFQQQRAVAALTGDDFAPLFQEFDRISTAGLFYHLTARFPHERAHLQGIRHTLHELERLLTTPEIVAALRRDPATGHQLSPDAQQTLSTLRQRLQQQMNILKAFMQY